MPFIDASTLAALDDLAGLLSVTIPAVIVALKGKPLLLAAGLLLTPIIWIIGSMRLAKPNSFWARQFYWDGKAARSADRFSSAQGQRDYSVISAAVVTTAFFALLGVAAWEAFA